MSILRDVNEKHVFWMFPSAEPAVATVSKEDIRTSINGLPHTNVTISLRQTKSSSSTNDRGHS